MRELGATAVLSPVLLAHLSCVPLSDMDRAPTVCMAPSPLGLRGHVGDERRTGWFFLKKELLLVRAAA